MKNNIYNDFVIDLEKIKLGYIMGLRWYFSSGITGLNSRLAWGSLSNSEATYIFINDQSLKKRSYIDKRNYFRLGFH